MIELARELLALKHRGILANVWIDAGQVRVSYPSAPWDRRYIANPVSFVERMRRKAAA